jgi:Zn-finger nucleic acid-binding protein
VEITLERTEAECPGCGEALMQLPDAPGVVAGCFRCGGAWLDNRATQWIVKVKPTPAMRAFVNALPASTGQPVNRDYRSPGYRGRRCPACSEELAPSKLRAPPLEVDVCANDGTYFDAQEALQLFRAIDLQGLEAEVIRTRREADRDWNGGVASHFVAELALGLLLGPPRHW